MVGCRRLLPLADADRVSCSVVSNAVPACWNIIAADALGGTGAPGELVTRLRATAFRGYELVLF